MSTARRTDATAAVTTAAPNGSGPSDAEIHARIVSAVLDHKLPPGTKLVEDKLASAFGVSRTRIRPVLARLASEQIVTLTPNRGAAIAQPTRQEALEVFEARRLVEPTLVARFCERTTAPALAALRACLAEEEEARKAGDMRRAIRRSGDFHLLIAEHAGQQTLGRILRELVSRTSLVLMAYSDAHVAKHADATACGCREHHALLGAIRLRLPEEAARLMRDHLTQLEAQLRFPAPDAAQPDFDTIFSFTA